MSKRRATSTTTEKLYRGGHFVFTVAVFATATAIRSRLIVA
jgi:hypothetical protein